MQKKVLFVIVSIAMLATVGFGQKYAGKKVLFIDSYDVGYPWSDGVEAGVKKILGPSGVVYEAIRMDTKKTNTTDELKKAAGAKVIAKINEWKPDVVIASDDNAAKFVIVAGFKDKPVNFVFDGINYDCTPYGFPWPNVTGMLEVSPMKALITNLEKYAKGNKVAYLGADNETNRKEVANIEKKFGLKLDAVYVTKFADWKKSFVALQTKNDMLMVDIYEGISDFKKDEAVAFVQENTKVPTGAVYDFLVDLAILSMTKVPEEQGEYAATTALQILDGKKPADFPVTQNKRFEFYANLKIAQKLGITLDGNILKLAKIIK